MHKHLIVVGGPTASGKTELAIRTALEYKTEIISADSRQFYKEMNIGTAKPSSEELEQVPHYFVNSLSIHEDYSAGEFEKDAVAKIKSLHQENDVVVMVGGSGLYIKAVCEGLDQFPETADKIRDELNDELRDEGIDKLWEELVEVDPEHSKKVDKQNPQRVLRALEVFRSCGKPYSHFLGQEKEKRPFQTHLYCIDWPRETLYQRINKRVDIMFQQGLLEEAKSLFPERKLNALQTVGYQELFAYLEGEIELEEAKRLIKRNTRRYAKRQLTWFRNQPNVNWINPKKDILLENLD